MLSRIKNADNDTNKSKCLIGDEEIDDLLFYRDAIASDRGSNQASVNTHQCMLGLFNHHLTSAIGMHTAMVKETTGDQ